MLFVVCENECNDNINKYMMKIYNINFSPTGGTKKVSDLLSSQLSESVSNVDLTDCKTDFSEIELTEEDVAIIAVPSYSGRVPAPAARRVAAIQAGGAKAVLVCVYGNRAYEDTLVELSDIAQRAGFRVMAAVAAVAEHSIARRFAAGRPDKQDMAQLTEFALRIRQKLSLDNMNVPEIPGHRPYRKAKAVGLIPKPTKECINCGVCAVKCPVSAIDKNHIRQIDKQTCISCMRCVAVCPHSARKVNRILLWVVNRMLKKVCSQRKDNELYL